MIPFGCQAKKSLNAAAKKRADATRETMIKVFVTIELRNKKFGQGFYLNNFCSLSEIVKNFATIIRKIWYQILMEIHGIKKESADIEARREMRNIRSL